MNRKQKPGRQICRQVGSNPFLLTEKKNEVRSAGFEPAHRYL